MSDIAEILAAEALNWLHDLSADGFIPRAFVGITQHGHKCVVQPAGALEHTDDLGFYRWLCRTQRIVAYFYVTHVAILKTSGVVDHTEERVTIYASSATLDLTVMLHIERHDDGSITYTGDQVFSQRPPDRPIGVFLGLQRSTAATDDKKQAAFEKIWQDLSHREQVAWLEKETRL